MKTQAQIDRINFMRRQKYAETKEIKRAKAREYAARPDVKEKRNKYAAEYRKKHPEKLVVKSQQYYQANKEKITEYKKLWSQTLRKKNPELARQRNDVYRFSHIEQEKARKTLYRKNNKAKLAAYAKKYTILRYQTDIEYNIKHKLRNRVRKALRTASAKKIASTQTLLGCTGLEFKNYIISKFTEGMTEEKLLSGEIHIDHIKPCDKFDLTDPEQQKICFHYTNLQPLWAKDNLIKQAKWSEDE